MTYIEGAYRVGVWLHALPDSGSKHSFISTHFYILLLFSICLSVRVAGAGAEAGVGVGAGHAWHSA